MQVVQWSTWLSALLNVKGPMFAESLKKGGTEAQNGVEMKAMVPKDMIMEIART
jgi:hypothetical protein